MHLISVVNLVIRYLLNEGVGATDKASAVATDFSIGHVTPRLFTDIINPYV